MKLWQSKNIRICAAVGATTLAIFSGLSGAEVLDQVPENAVSVFKIKNMEALDGKISKLASRWGIDSRFPELKDGLSLSLEKWHMTKGINKAGEGALVMFPVRMPTNAGDPADAAKQTDPDKTRHDAKRHEMNSEEPTALVAVSNYDAFLGNFTKADHEAGDGDITAVLEPQNTKVLYIAHRGNFAMISEKKERLLSKHIGLKLEGTAAQEVDSADAVILLNMPAIRQTLPEMKNHRAEILKQIHEQSGNDPKLKQMRPVVDFIANSALDRVEELVGDTTSAFFSMTISDEGVAALARVEFKPDSDAAKWIGTFKPAESALLAGLPDEKYFLVGGMSYDSKAMSQLLADNLPALIAHLRESGDQGAKIAADLEAFRTVAAASNHVGGGMIVPTKAMAEGGAGQFVAVFNGDVKEISGSAKDLLTAANDWTAMTSGQVVKPQIVSGADKTVDGTKLHSYAAKFDIDENSKAGLQLQQGLGIMFGPDDAAGTYGAVSEKAFTFSLGASDEILKELVASAKDDKDLIGEKPAMKSLDAHFPKNASLAGYIMADNLVRAAAKYAQAFGLGIKVKLPKNIVPIGMAVSTEGPAVRVDGFIPTQTVQDITAVLLEAALKVQQGGPNGAP